MKDCIFCKVIRGDLPSKKLFEDDKIIVIRDINPVAKTHILFIPRKHYKDFIDLDDDKVLSSIRISAQKLIGKENLTGRGYKIVVNGGGAQVVEHLHFHLIGPIGMNAKL